MINSFLPINTITSGLILQQLEEDIDASNLAQPSVDPQGYLMNSLEQVNAETNPSISFTGANGPVYIGTGVTAESVTSLRSSFLDNQIQQESSVLGYNSVFYATNGAGSTGIMDQINSILNASPTTTLGSALNAFTTAWNVLATPATATNVADQNAVVAAGQNFATTANSQYTQLQDLQTTMTGQMGQTVIQINQILQQLANINKQLLSSPGTNQNSLLDARDYALDKLSQLTNFQATFNADGTANVWVGDYSLVDASGAAILNVNATNYVNTTQSDVTIQSSQGSTTVADASSVFTGGTLGGELQARDVVIQNYMNQLNQITNSVITMTNNLYQAGYVANTATSNTTAFFTGTTAATIAVTGSLVSDSQSSAVPYLVTEVDPSSATGQLAGFLGNIQNLLAGNYLATANPIHSVPPAPTGLYVDPTAPLSPTIPTALGGSFTINGTTITYTNTGVTGTVDYILSQLNGISGVNAVFNATTNKFEIYSNTPLTFVGTGGDKFSWANLESFLVSTMPMNDTTAENQAQVEYGNEPINANYPTPPTGPNSLAFLVTPSSTGVIIVNGVQVAWNNTESLNDIFTSPTFPASASPNWNQGAQKIELLNTAAGHIAATPVQIVDQSGNLTAALWLQDSSLPIGDLSTNMLTQLSTQATTFQTAYTTSAASVVQLNTEQDNLAGAAGTFKVNGVATPVGTANTTFIEQQALQSMITYNAMLEVMEIIDQTLDSLVGATAPTISNGIFQQQQP
jgi:flagellar hook-associated protein FlgK